MSDNNALELKDSSSRTIAPLTRADLEGMKSRRELLKEFVQSQLKQADLKKGLDGDYGVVPGTQKPSLLKPGAEKLLRLFNLGARVRMADKEFDFEKNYAEFTYRCEVYNLATGIVIAECEGSASSQEVKYRERRVWRDTGKKTPEGKPVKEQVNEITPISDVSNTLKKMAQKRAIVGATILATGASDFFTQDVDTEEDAQAVGMKARQEGPKAPAGANPGEFVIPFGKFKGQSLAEITPDDLRSYAEFLGKQPDISVKGQEVCDAIAMFLGK
jgi:hypothetical protein